MEDDELKLLTPEDLALLLGRKVKSIKVDASRRPETLPPRFVVPGSKLLRWRRADVAAWMEAWAELDRQRRSAVRDLARKTGTTTDKLYRPISLDSPTLGQRASQQLARKG